MKTKQWEWTETFEAARAEAKTSNRPIYVDFFNPD